MAQRIIGIVGKNENEALLTATVNYSAAFQALGYDVSIADTSTQDGFSVISSAIQNGEVFFCYGMQGVGSHLLCNGDLNLWETFSVPFVGLHYDSPCYNPANHKNDSLWVANIYFAESFLDVQRRYIGGNQINMALPFGFTPPQYKEIPFAERPIKYLFLKTGGSLDLFADQVQTLPLVWREGIWSIVRQAENDPNLCLCDLVRALMTSCGTDFAACQNQFWAITRGIDDYLRRKRAIDLVNWLKKQEGTVVVGSHWDFIDRKDVCASFLPAVPAKEADRLYAQAQFVFNTNPYGPDIIHERIVSGLMQGCCVITDSNAWWDSRFADVPALLRINLNNPLEGQIRPFVQGDAAARAATGLNPALKHFSSGNNCVSIVACVEQMNRRAKESA